MPAFPRASTVSGSRARYLPNSTRAEAFNPHREEAHGRQVHAACVDLAAPPSPDDASHRRENQEAARSIRSSFETAAMRPPQDVDPTKQEKDHHGHRIHWPRQYGLSHGPPPG